MHWLPRTLSALSVLLALSLLAPTPTPIRAQVPAATLLILDGTVVVVRADGSTLAPADNGLPLGQGDAISTVGRASAAIGFVDGSIASLGSGTTVVIHELAVEGERLTVVLETVLGSTSHYVKPFGHPESSYRVVVGESVAATRGATFDHSVDPSGEVTVSVTEGTIEFPSVGEPLGAGGERAVILQPATTGSDGSGAPGRRPSSPSGGSTPTPSDPTPAASDVAPAESAAAVETPTPSGPTPTNGPTATPEPTSTPKPSSTPKPTSAKPTDTPVPTSTPMPTSTPVPTATRAPTNTPAPTTTRPPVGATNPPAPTPVPTNTPTRAPTSTPTPTSTALPTNTATPTATPNVVPSSISISAGAGQSAQAGLTFGAPLKVIVRNSGGAPLGGVNVTFSAPVVGPGGAFTGQGASGPTATAVTDGSGVATAPTLTANGTVGDFAVTASVGALTAQLNLSIVENTTPHHVVGTAGNGQIALAGTAFAAPLQATVYNVLNQPLHGVTVTFTAPASGASATFPENARTATAVTNVSGVATAPTVTAGGTAGQFTVTAGAGSATPASFTLTTTVNQTPASVTVIGGSGQSTQIGLALAVPLRVAVMNVLGEPMEGVTVTFTAPNAGASATFGGSTVAQVVTDEDGQAAAPQLTANGVVGSYAVTATVGALTATFSLSNTANTTPAAVEATAGTPQSTGVNTVFPTRLKATVENLVGQPVSGVSVTFTIDSPDGSVTFASGETSGAATTDATGVATAPPLLASSTPGTATVTARVGALSATYSLTVTP